MEDKSGVEVYDLLGRLEGERAKEAGIQLITLGGQLGSVGGGYFFEKQSATYLEGVCETPVFDESGNKAGTVPSPSCFFSYVYMGMGAPRHTFDPANHQYRMEPPISEQEEHALWKMREKILEQLNAKGKEAVDEYRLVAAAMGGQRLTAEALTELLKVALGFGK